MGLFDLTQEFVDAAHGRFGNVMDGRSPKRKDLPKSITAFKNPFLEKWFGRAHPITPILWFGPFIVLGWYRGLRGPLGIFGTIGLFLAGWLAWTLMEYLLHRFVFHWEPKREEDKVKAFSLHGYHHLFADDKMRLVAPPVMSWGPAILIGITYYLLLGPERWMTLYAGHAAGYVAYDWIHYYTHHFRPKGGIGKWLRRYHMIHHYKHHDACYGVSTPLWDLVFGTYRPLESAASSQREDTSAAA